MRQWYRWRYRTRSSEAHLSPPPTQIYVSAISAYVVYFPWLEVLASNRYTYRYRFGVSALEPDSDPARQKVVAMTFDVTEVGSFTDDLAAQMDRCDNGEGMECATLDSALIHYARLCCNLDKAIRLWAREVFAGRVAFDPEVEAIWLSKGLRLLCRAMDMVTRGIDSEDPCYFLEGQQVLIASVMDLHRLLKGWVTPKTAVGPSARHGLPLSLPEAEEARRRVAALPSLPTDWKPNVQRQCELYRKLKSN